MEMEGEGSITLAVAASIIVGFVGAWALKG